MNLRDLGPWLIPPLALFAASVPRLNSGPQVAANESALINLPTLTSQNPAVAPSTGAAVEPSPGHPQKQLDHYDDDARNLLWKFINTRKLAQNDDRKVALTLKTTDAGGEIQVDEHLDSSVAANDPVGADSVLNEQDQSRSSSSSDVPADQELGAYLEPFDVKFLIVTLPDPIDSHLQFDFDSALEALQAAMDNLGYSRDRYSLPWTEHTNASDSKTASADTEPGLILFRGHCADSDKCSNKTDKLLMVFVVGESPTDGVHKLALSSALEQAAELSVLTRSRENQDRLILNLLGPYFTGSTLSIESVFQSHRQWLNEQAVPGGFKVRVISGSAVAIDQYAFSERLAQGDDHPNVHFDPFSATIDYTPAVLDDFLDYLQEQLNEPPERIAILRESDTGYGQSIKPDPDTFGNLLRYLKEKRDQAATPTKRTQLRAVVASLRIYLEYLARFDFDEFRRILHQSPESFEAGNPFSQIDITDAATEYYTQQKVANPAAKAIEAQSAYEALAADWFDQYHLQSYIDIPFPSHISELRGVREAQLASQQSLSFDPGSQFFFPVLTAGAEGKDTLPSFSPQDKASADLVMEDAFATLTRNKVDYVGILATDVRDTIYLAEEIHRNCPNITVFTFGGNLLFLSPEFGADLRGMLVVTTYPVYTLNQRWTYPWRRDSIRHFPDEAAEGVYNATLALLGKPSALLEYEVPFSKPDQNGPPIWITAVGKQNLVPVAVRPQELLGALYLTNNKPNKMQSQGVKDKQTAKTQLQRSIEISEAKRPQTATALFWSSTAFCVFFAFFSLWPSHGGIGAAWRVFAPTPSLRRLAALGAFWAALLLFYFLVAGIVICPWLAACKDCGLRTKYLTNAWPVVYPPILLMVFVFILLLLRMLTHIVMLCLRGLWKDSTSRHQRHATQLIGRPNNTIRLPSHRFLHYLSRIAHSVFGMGRFTLELLSGTVNFILSTAILFLAVSYFVYLINTSAADDPYELASTTFAALRYADLGNGVSPFLPLLFIALGLLVWCASKVRRIAMLEAMGISHDSANYPSEVAERSFLGFDRGSSLDLAPLENRIQVLLSSCSLRNPAAFLIILFIGAALASALFDQLVLKHPLTLASLFWSVVRTPPVPSIEGSEFDWLFAVLFVAVGIALAMNMLRFAVVWRALRRLLRRVAWHPLHKACAQLGALNHESSSEADNSRPGNAKSVIPQVSLTSTMPTFTGLAFSVEKAAEMMQCIKEAAAQAVKHVQHRAGGAGMPGGELVTRLNTYEGQLLHFCRQARVNLTKALDADAAGDLRTSQNCKLNTQRELANLSAYSAYILEPVWETPENPYTAGRDIQREWSDAASLFLASRILDYSRHILAQLRNLVGFSTAGVLLMLMAVSSYPFPHSDSLLRVSWMMLLAVVVLGIWIFIQINRDETLSLLRGGTPGRIDWNGAFVAHLALYALLPMIALLGIQFPATLDGIVRALAAVLPNAGH